MSSKMNWTRAGRAVCGAAGLMLVASCANAGAKDSAKSEVARAQTVAETGDKKTTEVPKVLGFKMKSLDGKDVDLSRYAGKVVMIVNTASKCGHTPQYAGLQKLHEQYGKDGLAILGFPANDFGQQEPGSDTDILGFCEKNFGVKFDMFSKVQVTGDGKTPLYKFLTDEKTNPKFPGEIGWNFEKFLIGRDGEILNRFKSGVKPESEEIKAAISAALKK